MKPQIFFCDNLLNILKSVMRAQLYSALFEECVVIVIQFSNNWVLFQNLCKMFLDDVKSDCDVPFTTVFISTLLLIVGSNVALKKFETYSSLNEFFKTKRGFLSVYPCQELVYIWLWLVGYGAKNLQCFVMMSLP